MKKKLHITLFLISLCNVIFSQNLVVQNPSFEGTPSAHITPPLWGICMPGCTPDTQPGIWGVSLPPSDGSTYLGMCHEQSGNWQEGASQELLDSLTGNSEPMQAGVTYTFTIDVSDHPTSGSWVVTGPVELLVWGGFSDCDETELLWSSGDVPNFIWTTYNVSFTPSMNFTHIMFQCNALTFPTGYLIIDNMSSITPPSNNVIFNNTCYGDSAIFNLSNTSVDSVFWDFGDPITGIDNYSDSINPFHIFSDTGAFVITAYYYNSSVMDSLIDTIQIYSNPNVTYSLISPSCFGDSLGSIDLSISGSVSPYIYSWSNGESSEDLDSLISGLYSVTITDQNGCTTLDSITLSEPTPLVSSVQSLTNFNGFDLSCFGDSLGSIDLSISGSVSPYIYSWSNGESSEDLDSLISGLYSVTITDQNGCTTLDSITLSEPTPLVSSVQSLTNFNGFDLSCFGDSLGSIDLSISGSVSPYIYSWSNGESSEDLDSLISGLYSVTITDQNGCTTLDSITLSEPTPLVSSVQSLTNFNGFDLSCFGDSLGSIDLSISGSVSPYIYSWSNGESSEDLDSLISGLYSVTITDQNGCTTLDSITLSEPTPLVSSVQSLTNFNGFDLSCFGDSLGSIDLSISGSVSPYIYSWSNGESSEDLDSLISGLYSVTITDQNGCTTLDSITLSEPTPLVSSVQSLTNFNGFDLSCFGDSLGSIDLSISGSVSPYIYSWSNGESSEDLDSLISGLYSVTITDQNGCTTLDSITLSEPTPLVSSVQSLTNFNGFDLSCFGDSLGSIDLSISGSVSPYIYSWSNGESSEDLDSLISGLYSVTITDQNGCTTLDSITLSEPTPFIKSSLINHVKCNAISDGNINIFPFGSVSPYTYLWSNGDTLQFLQNIPAGQYSVIITDYNNCTLYDTLNVGEPSILSYNELTDSVSCFGNNDGLIDLTINGGIPPYTYLWNTGDTLEDISNLIAGSYVVNVLDSNDCLLIANVDVYEPDDLFAYFNLNYVSCNGLSDGNIDAVTIGGTPPFNYSWSTGDTTEDLLNIPSDMYILSLTDNNNCFFTDTIVVFEPDELIASLTDSNGTLVSIGSGGTTPYTYDIYSPAGIFATASNNMGVSFIINPVLTGTYTLVVTDANGCIDSSQVTITASSIFENSTLDEIKLYPNPSRDIFYLSFNSIEVQDLTISILNVVGEEVYKEDRKDFVGEYTKQISLENNGKGIYFLELETNFGIVNKKLILQ